MKYRSALVSPIQTRVFDFDTSLILDVAIALRYSYKTDNSNIHPQTSDAVDWIIELVQSSLSEWNWELD